jgi:NAD(P)H-hydrate epimerase
MPGLVTVLCESSVYIPVASQLQAAMVHAWEPGTEIPANCTGLVIGPGLASSSLGTDWKDFVNDQWQNFPHPVLVDASALDWLKAGPVSSKSARIITPHPGEAARLLRRTPAEVQEDRTESLRLLSQSFGNCWVVLKGFQTLIGRNTGVAYINPSGNSLLAQGGSGDVLSGYLGGLLAQPELQKEALKVIRSGVWEHGAAADCLSEARASWGIEELLQTIGTGKS